MIEIIALDKLKYHFKDVLTLKNKLIPFPIHISHPAHSKSTNHKWTTK